MTARAEDDDLESRRAAHAGAQREHDAAHAELQFAQAAATHAPTPGAIERIAAARLRVAHAADAVEIHAARVAEAIATAVACERTLAGEQMRAAQTRASSVSLAQALGPIVARIVAIETQLAAEVASAAPILEAQRDAVREVERHATTLGVRPICAAPQDVDFAIALTRVAVAGAQKSQGRVADDGGVVDLSAWVSPLRPAWNSADREIADRAQELLAVMGAAS